MKLILLHDGPLIREMRGLKYVILVLADRRMGSDGMQLDADFFTFIFEFVISIFHFLFDEFPAHYISPRRRLRDWFS
jgi:hypothetical protein